MLGIKCSRNTADEYRFIMFRQISYGRCAQSHHKKDTVNDGLGKYVFRELHSACGLLHGGYFGYDYPHSNTACVGL